MTITETRMLDQHLAEGKLPPAEALRIAMNLADAVRRVHEDGRFHGALAPSCIELTSSGVELLPARIPHGVPTPYTAPEVLRGKPADARSDIFAFGAVLYEMVTGRWPFEAKTPEDLATAILNTEAPGTGNSALDSLLANCLAKDPEGRWQRMQKVQMALRLLTVSVRRSDGPPRPEHISNLIRREIQQAIDSRIAPRLQSQETTVAELQQAVTASLQAMQAHFCTIDAKLAAAQERLARCDEAASELHLRISSLEKRVDGPQERITRAELLLQTATERLGRAEQNTETLRQSAEGTAVELHSLGQTLRSQGEALEAARRTMAQTDDLVERVVEALDSLQTIVLEHSEDRPSAVN